MDRKRKCASKKANIATQITKQGGHSVVLNPIFDGNGNRENISKNRCITSGWST